MASWISCLSDGLYNNPSYLTGVVIIIFVFIQTKKSNQKEKVSDKKGEVLCDKPSCHRCSRNTELLTRAKNVFDMSFLTSRRKLIRISEALDNPETQASHTNYILHIRSLTSIPVWSYDDLPETYKADYRLLKENIHVFVRDYLDYKSGNNHSFVKEDYGQNDWSKLFFYNQGDFFQEMCYDACYKTYQVFTRCENLMQSCVFGYAFFSVLRPSTRIEKHCGPTNCRLRCHVSVDIPRDAEECSMDVCGTEVKWENDGVVFFDDSLEHSVSYSTNGSSEIALSDGHGPDTVSKAGSSSLPSLPASATDRVYTREHSVNYTSDIYTEHSPLLDVDDPNTVPKTASSLSNPRSSSAADRVVLLLDFWHPDLTFDERMCIQMCFCSD